MHFAFLAFFASFGGTDPVVVSPGTRDAERCTRGSLEFSCEKVFSLLVTSVQVTRRESQSASFTALRAPACSIRWSLFCMESALADGGVERFFACLDHTMAMGPHASVTRAVAVRFDLGGVGSFLLKASPHAPGSVTKEEPSSRSEDAVTCTLSCSLTVLLDLAGGRIKPAAAYLRGLISVAGDRAVSCSYAACSRRR